MNKIMRTAFVDAVATALYVIVVALFMYFLQDNLPKEFNSVFIPIAMLLLFVFSAALTGVLVFGRPIATYLDGKKKEALLMLTYTLAALFVLTVLAFVLVAVYIKSY